MAQIKNLLFNYKLDELDSVIREIVLPCIKPGATLLLQGQLGAGKTTFVKALARALELVDDVSSPTFSYVNTYRGLDKGLLVYHFDLYRLSSLEEFIALGFDEFLAHPYAIKLVEWPEVAKESVVAAACKERQVVSLIFTHDFEDMHHRKAELTVYG